jgi:hypothetical protein
MLPLITVVGTLVEAYISKSANPDQQFKEQEEATVQHTRGTVRERCLSTHSFRDTKARLA